MAPPHCEIRFDDNPQGVYHGGQILSGSVELRLDKPKLVNDFRLVISGCAEVRWSERRTRDRKVTYTGKEDLLRAETKLIPESNSNTEIPAGIHVYNFSSPIPSHVPTSFEGEHGKIRYTVRAILERPWKFDQTCTAAFTVLKPLDLNQLIYTTKVSRKETLIKTFCCWPCTSNPLYIEVEIPVSGYVPGQKIPITVALNNTSSTTIVGIKSSLERKVTYISQYPREKSRVVGKCLASVWTTVTTDKSATYSQNLEIPSVAPTGKCSVLVIDYLLKVKVHCGGLHSNPKIKIPITIGTIPFALSPTTTAAGPNDNIGWSNDTVNAPSAPMLPPSPIDKEDLPPPSYEEAMHGTAINVNDDEPNAIGFQAFIPRYPVYNFDAARNN
ncbi:AAEL008165-PA [Aedes aegypti]|uniref:AAEL008165-PA n=2 Tax=Aedes aegypti TaxID=7159 RepID=A0A1S4FIT5_AEDAE|nr:arrestin domain-containing protein 2 [Aedes aegypti]EAT40077.1 AAEL008165-PA [Aedes aegypti]